MPFDCVPDNLNISEETENAKNPDCDRGPKKTENLIEMTKKEDKPAIHTLNEVDQEEKQ